MKYKGVILFVLFVVYACVVFLTQHSLCLDCTTTINFYCGFPALGVTLLFLFVWNKYFDVVLLLFFVGSVWFFEFQPYNVIINTFRIGHVTVFSGRSIPFLFLILYVILYKKEIVHFFKTNRLLN